MIKYIISYSPSSVNNIDMPIIFSEGRISVGPGNFCIASQNYILSETDYELTDPPSSNLLGINVWIVTDESSQATIIVDEIIAGHISFNFSGTKYKPLIRLAWATSDELKSETLNVQKVVVQTQPLFTIPTGAVHVKGH